MRLTRFCGAGARARDTGESQRSRIGDEVFTSSERQTLWVLIRKRWKIRGETAASSGWTCLSIEFFPKLIILLLKISEAKAPA